MFHCLNQDRSLWPDCLLTLPEGQYPEFNYTEAGTSNSNMARLQSAWNKGPAPRYSKGPSPFPFPRSERRSER